MAVLRVACGALALVTLVFGCSSDRRDPEVAGSSSTSTTEPATQQCVAPTYQLEYPTSWHTSSSDGAAACRWFHHRPFELPEATEVVEVAVHVRYEPRTLDELVDAERGEVLDRREEKVDDRRAVRMRVSATGDALLPAGTETVSWYLDTGSRTLVAATSDAAAGPLEDNVKVLDSMIESIDVIPEVVCSAAGLDGDGAVDGDLPEAVLRTRATIIRAALACDYAALADVARRAGDAFSFSFGGGDDPAAFWRDAERSGAEPLRHLVQVLGLEHASQDVDGRRHLVWPAAHTYESWDAVPPEHQAELRRIYGPELVDSFDQAGAYLGHRLAIDEDGAWLFFIAGD